MKLVANRLELIRALGPARAAAEIGVYRGEFSAQILSEVPSLVDKMYLVDLWRFLTGDSGLDPLNHSAQDHEENFLLVKDRFAGDGRVEVVRADSSTFLRALSESGLFLNWIYIDADHTGAGVWKDLVAAQEVIEPDGWICGHDYCVNGTTLRCKFGVYDAVNEFCRMYGWHLEIASDEDWPSYALRRL